MEYTIWLHDEAVRLESINIVLIWKLQQKKVGWKKLYSSRKPLCLEKKLHPGSFEDMAHEITFGEGRPCKDVCLGLKALHTSSILPFNLPSYLQRNEAMLVGVFWVGSPLR